MTPGVDFGPLAARYDELRPIDDNWWEVTEALVREGDLRTRRVLDVGCGTGAFAAALADRYEATVWGVDPSPEMVERARGRVTDGLAVTVGRAEDLPFADRWFERVVMRLVVHLVERPAAFGEAARVLAPGGRIVIATFDPDYFEGYYLGDLFPSVKRIDRSRFPAPETLMRELEAAGFVAPRVFALSQQATITRKAALEKIRGRHISTFQLVPEAEYRDGLARAERELPRRVQYEVKWAILVAERR